MTSVGVSVMVVMSPSCVAGDTGARTDGHNNDEASGGAGSYQVTSIRTGRLKRLIRYGTSPGPTRPEQDTREGQFDGRSDPGPAPPTSSLFDGDRQAWTDEEQWPHR